MKKAKPKRSEREKVKGTGSLGEDSLEREKTSQGKGKKYFKQLLPHVHHTIIKSFFFLDKQKYKLNWEI